MRLISYASPSDSNTETRLAVLFAIQASAVNLNKVSVYTEANRK